MALNISKIIAALAAILSNLLGRRKPIAGRLRVFPDKRNFPTSYFENPTMTAITTAQRADFELAYTNSVTGRPALVDGPPVWTLEPASAGTLTVAADGLAASFIPDPAISESTAASIKVVADGEFGPGVRQVETFGALAITVAGANVGTLTATVTDQ